MNDNVKIKNIIEIRSQRKIDKMNSSISLYDSYWQLDIIEILQIILELTKEYSIKTILPAINSTFSYNSICDAVYVLKE